MTPTKALSKLPNCPQGAQGSQQESSSRVFGSTKKRRGILIEEIY